MKPTPFRVSPIRDTFIEDANGTFVAMTLDPDEALLIVAAVNHVANAEALVERTTRPQIPKHDVWSKPVPPHAGAQ